MSLVPLAGQLWRCCSELQILQSEAVHFMPTWQSMAQQTRNTVNHELNWIFVICACPYLYECQRRDRGNNGETENDIVIENICQSLCLHRYTFVTAVPVLQSDRMWRLSCRRQAYPSRQRYYLIYLVQPDSKEHANHEQMRLGSNLTANHKTGFY